MKRLIYTALVAIIGTACTTDGEERNRTEYVGVNIAEASMVELGYAAAIIKSVIDYNDYLIIESSDADDTTKELAWRALGYFSRTLDGNKHHLITETTSSEDATITTVTLDAVELNAGGKWRVIRSGYKPFTMEITGDKDEVGGYTVKFENITVGDAYLYYNEHSGTAHFNVIYNKEEDKFLFVGKLSSIHRDKSEYYPLHLTTEIVSPMRILIDKEYFAEGSIRIVCSDQYYHTADNVNMVIHNMYDSMGMPIVEVEYNDKCSRIGRKFMLRR